MADAKTAKQTIDESLNNKKQNQELQSVTDNDHKAAVTDNAITLAVIRKALELMHKYSDQRNDKRIAANTAAKADLLLHVLAADIRLTGYTFHPGASCPAVCISFPQRSDFSVLVAYDKQERLTMMLSSESGGEQFCPELGYATAKSVTTIDEIVHELKRLEKVPVKEYTFVSDVYGILNTFGYLRPS